jgi:CheW-like domain
MSLRGRQAGARSLTPSVRFLVVTVGGACVALHADRIQGLQTIEEAGSAGPLTVQGLEYAYINLALRLRRPVDAEGSDTRVILFSKGHVRGNIRAAQVHGLKDIEVSQILPLPPQFRGEEQRWYQGMILFESTVALVLNPAWVLEESAVSAGLALETSQAGSSLVPFRGQPLIGGQTKAC